MRVVDAEALPAPDFVCKCRAIQFTCCSCRATTIRSCAAAWQACRRTSPRRTSWQLHAKRSKRSPPSPTYLPAASGWTCSRSPSKPFPTDQPAGERFPMSAETPRERPILFNDQMVRAILEGRKTVTRRAVKGLQIPTEDKRHRPARHPALRFNVFGSTEEECAHELARFGVCPFGRPATGCGCARPFAEIGCRLTFRADLEDGLTAPSHAGPHRCTCHAGPPASCWRSPPVRVERLQQITIGEICKEGLARSMYEFIPVTTAFDAFAELWNSTGWRLGRQPLGLGRRVQAGGAVNTLNLTAMFIDGEDASAWPSQRPPPPRRPALPRLNCASSRASSTRSQTMQTRAPAVSTATRHRPTEPAHHAIRRKPRSPPHKRPLPL
ncbi:Uncharacterised protein [Pseudomonas aeruginosa]|nr:Uncharacterised protein [Pseudomonas aeruginosa]